MVTTTNANAAGRVYDWNERYEQDSRRKTMLDAVDRILMTSFPAISEHLAKQQLPKQRQETAPPPPANGVKPEPATKSSAPAYDTVDANAYMTESSSEAESQAEVDPMEELREMERRVALGQPALDNPRHTKKSTAKKKREIHRVQQEEMLVDQGGDVDMAEDDGDEDDDEDDDDGECPVCHKSDNEKQVLLCDTTGCKSEYHMYCLTPPLTVVPAGKWFCPPCVAKRSPSSHTPAAPTPSTTRTATNEDVTMDVDDEPLSAEIVRIKQERERALGWVPAQDQQQQQQQHQQPQHAATSVSIAQTFEQDAERSNALLVHACNCDSVRCVDPQFREFCAHMKRFLRSACWASHNAKWLTYRIAQATADLLAYHSLHCQQPRCNVPLCDELRAEEYV